MIACPSKRTIANQVYAAAVYCRSASAHVLQGVTRKVHVFAIPLPRPAPQVCLLCVSIQT